MPVWYWFAFDPKAVASAVLQPAQQAVRDVDLAAWQKTFDQLSETHPRPYVSVYGYSPNKATIITPGRDELTRNTVPKESDFPLRRALQTFVEHASGLTVEGTFFRPRHWVMREVAWPKLLSRPELDEMAMFKEEFIAGRSKLPDPFWCLESNSAVDSNFIAPEVVARMADMEATAGLFRKLTRRSDLDEEIASLARDLAAAALLIELAAAGKLALFFREDGT